MADKEKSMAYFKEMVLPRRCRDLAAEENLRETVDKHEVVYRKVLPDEEERGEPYPVCSAGLRTFAHFGIGIGIYYMQLLILSAITLLSGLIMVLAIIEYGSGSYGVQSSLNPLIAFTAACEPAQVIKDVPVDSCSGLEDVCKNNLADLNYRPNCELPLNAVYADLAMSAFFFAMILLSRFAEGKLEQELDEAVQTAQDYSVVVNDPCKNAEDPDEWYEFFSRFGTVRYITITRKNQKLTELVTLKHKLETTASELRNALVQRGEKLHKKIERIQEQLDEVTAKLEAAFLHNYRIGRVYVTYEFEEHQRLCLQEMEVPDIIAILDVAGFSKQRTLFRSAEVLDVVEPPEPDSVLWSNLEVGRKTRLVKIVVSYIFTLLTMVALFYIVNATFQVSPLLLSLVIGFVDALLPALFQSMVDYSAPHSEGQRQSDIQVRLFLARLLLSTGFPYYTTAWDSVLTVEFIQQIMIVQLSASFVSPLIQMMDIGGIVTRHIVGPSFANTQGDLNTKFNGSKWNLAEKYTGIAKILFLSLFYALLNPFSLFVATVAFCVVFLIDRNLLLRRWEPSCMLDAAIAKRLRQQGMLAVTAHLYISLRFIYSWPMDQVTINKKGDFEYADKFPDFSVVDYMPQDWHSSVQDQVLPAYRIGFFIIGGITLYIWVIAPLIRSLTSLFCYNRKVVGRSQGIGFSEVEKILAYVPTVKYKTETFLCSFIQNMLDKHRPKLLRPVPGDIDDLSIYVPMQHRPHVLSIVKYYGTDAASAADADVNLAMSHYSKNAGTNTNTVRSVDVETGLHRNDDIDIALDSPRKPTASKSAVLDSEFESMLIKSLTTQPLPKFTTDKENVLHQHYNALPADLLAVIGNQPQLLLAAPRRDLDQQNQMNAPKVTATTAAATSTTTRAAVGKQQKKVVQKDASNFDDVDQNNKEDELYNQYEQELQEKEMRREINPIASTQQPSASTLPVDVAKAIGLPDPDDPVLRKKKKSKNKTSKMSLALTRTDSRGGSRSSRSLSRKRITPIGTAEAPPLTVSQEAQTSSGATDDRGNWKKSNRVFLQPLALI